MLRDELRLHTRSHHERIEAVMDIPASIRAQDDYVHLLGALYGFHAPLEARLLEHEDALSCVGVSLSVRRKAYKLRDDLQSLRVTRQAIDELALCASLPALPTWKHALGSLYVVEGATLGGQVIARQLRRDLDLRPDLHMRFFSAYGAESAAMWRAFVHSLNAMTLAAEERANVLQGARETFEALERWMSIEDRRRRV